MMLKKILLLFICFTISPLETMAAIVDPSITYTYEELTEDLKTLKKHYPDSLSYHALTTTENGRAIWAVRLGKGHHSILIHGAHHAREWLTSTLLMKMMETYAQAYDNNEKIGKLHTEILDETSIWFVPMVNPDGVALQQHGAVAFPLYYQPFLIEMNKGSTNFKRWKANLGGIDLNRQYPANWDHLNRVKAKPYYQFYKGTEPLEAREAKALVDFTRKIKPELAVSYHSSGNVVFWGYHIWGLTHSTNYTDDYYRVAEKISKLTNYPIKKPASHQQGGGYTDWFIEEFNKPGLTIEIGELIKENSLPLKEFPEIWDKNKEVGLLLAKIATEKREKK